MISTSPWRTSRYHTDLVPLPNTSRKISVAVSGRPRTASQPLVIIAAGLGGVAAEHVVVAQLIAPFARVLRFDRAGYGASTRRSDAATMANGVKDLSVVLELIDLKPPYILIGQSFGGFFIREFLQQRGKEEVVGMVMVDVANPVASREEVMEAGRLIEELCGEEAYEDVNGLRRNVVLTPEQLDVVHREGDGGGENGTVEREMMAADQSRESINAAQGMEVVEDGEGNVVDLRFSEKPLGKGRMSIVLGDFPRDFEAALEYGKAKGNGDEEVYRKAESVLLKSTKVWQKFQEAHGGLTEGEVRVRTADGTGRTHNLHLTRPDIVAEEVRWVLDGVV